MKIAPQAIETMESAAENPSRSPAVTAAWKSPKGAESAKNGA
jgi:hypothetical protein